MAVKIVDVKLIPSTVMTGQSVTVEIEVRDGTWETIKDLLDWNAIRNGFNSWQDLKDY